MSDMIERVAEAIFLKEGRAKDVAWVDADKVLALVPVGSWRERQPPVTDYYRAIARAAIEAMREPTEAIVEAVQTEVDIWPEHNPKPAPNFVQFVSRDEAVGIWQAGIDAALAEGSATNTAFAQINIE